MLTKRVGQYSMEISGQRSVEFNIDELTQNGVVVPERLFESPFTDVNAQGPLAVFPPGQVARIVDVLKDIRSKAAA